jgi:hypothetical protein
MRGAIPPLPEYVLMAWCLVKHRDNFTFYLYLFKIFYIWRRKLSNPRRRRRRRRRRR